MSWVACSVGPIAAEAAAIYTHAQTKKLKVPHFASCKYCGKAADQDQKKASCTSCGAPLKEKP